MMIDLKFNLILVLVFIIISTIDQFAEVTNNGAKLTRRRGQNKCLELDPSSDHRAFMNGLEPAIAQLELVDTKSNTRQLCMGVKIEPEVVLTTASCLSALQDTQTMIKVAIGQDHRDPNWHKEPTWHRFAFRSCKMNSYSNSKPNTNDLGVVLVSGWDHEDKTACISRRHFMADGGGEIYAITLASNQDGSETRRKRRRRTRRKFEKTRRRQVGVKSRLQSHLIPEGRIRAWVEPGIEFDLPQSSNKLNNNLNWGFPLFEARQGDERTWLVGITTPVGERGQKHLAADLFNMQKQIDQLIDDCYDNHNWTYNETKDHQVTFPRDRF